MKAHAEDKTEKEITPIDFQNLSIDELNKIFNKDKSLSNKEKYQKSRIKLFLLSLLAIGTFSLCVVVSNQIQRNNDLLKQAMKTTAQPVASLWNYPVSSEHPFKTMVSVKNTNFNKNFETVNGVRNILLGANTSITDLAMLNQKSRHLSSDEKQQLVNKYYLNAEKSAFSEADIKKIKDYNEEFRLLLLSPDFYRGDNSYNPKLGQLAMDIITDVQVLTNNPEALNAYRANRDTGLENILKVVKEHGASDKFQSIISTFYKSAISE